VVQAFGPVTFGLAALSLAASAAGVWVTIRLAHKGGRMDFPNERSSHSVPTPRMGGIAMVAAVVLSYTSWAFLVSGELFWVRAIWAVPLFALVMSGLGLWDDLSGLSPLFRFSVQIAVSVAILFVLGTRVPPLRLAGYSVHPAIWVPFGSVWVVWMLNLYNFMDGIDGLAGGEAAVAASFFFLVFAHYGESGWAAANLFIAAASMGFLVHNWPPATVFMGDAGSVFLGGFFGMQTVAASLMTPIPFVVLVLPFSNFILDTTFTLFRRLIRREKWYQAHRSHVYQRMTDLGMTHRKVTSIELLVVVASCAAAAACIPAGPAVRIALVVSVAAGIACGGLLVWGKERAVGASQE
jgi:UDP-N-acetylmuramyl pentapeptide phosphotransferase/UDP-N-acetylglucosamine-1-phosphate transferase